MIPEVCAPHAPGDLNPPHRNLSDGKSIVPARTDMHAANYWKKIRNGTEKHIVLTVDFDSGGRSEATFSDLAKNLTSDVSIYETDPLGLNREIGFTGIEYITAFVNSAMLIGKPIAAIAGFCVGSTYAEFLVRRIAELQEGAPELVLFDPDIVTRNNLIRQLRQSAAAVSSLFTPAEIAEINLSIQQSITEYDDMSQLATSIVTRFIEISQAAFDRARIAAILREELTTAFRSYVAYLCGSSTLTEFPTEFPGWQNATCVLSDMVGQEHLLTINDAQFRSVARTTNSHESLLKSAEARSAIEYALASYRNR